MDFSEVNKKFGNHLKRTVLAFVAILIIAILLEGLLIGMLVRKNASSSVNLLLNQIEIVLKENKESEKQQIHELKDAYISQAKLIAYIISNSPQIATDIDELKKIAALQSIDEIHIFDSTGKIYAGTKPEYYGYSFDSGEQMAFFNPMLSDKSLSMCQDITPNTAEGKNMMYAIAWTSDGTKMVQIGITPVHLIEFLSDTDVSRVINNIPVTRGFDIYVVDMQNLKISATTNNHIEDPNLALSFRAKISHRLKKKGKGLVFHKGDFYYIDFRRVDKYVAAASYCLTNSSGHFTLPIITISVYMIISGLFILRLIYNLYQANTAKTKFLNNMSHDIRTPMNAILGFARLIENNKDEPEKIQDYVKKIESAGEYLLSLINSVLDMARIESGRIEFQTSTIDIRNDFEALVSFFENDFNEKELTRNVSLNIEHNFIVGDAQKIQQIYVNLVSNAVKYTQKGGTVGIEVNEVPCEKPGFATYVGKISDNGIGISQEFKKHIFESFSREQTSTESRIGGTGLGMSIVKKLVDIMGGTIEIESQPGKGSVFTVSLSMKIASPQDVMSDEKTQEISAGEFEGFKVLLVEDNDLNAEIATEVLTGLGLKVERAENGLACLQKISNEPEEDFYDMILMDIQMPGIDGFEATRRIRKLEDRKKAGVAIIAMTANAFEKDKQNAIKAGMNGHLVKPIDIASLVSTLKKFLLKKV